MSEMEMSECDSDDEIFFGKMTIKEVKKRLFFGDKQRQTISCDSSNPQENARDASLQLIETQSEPDYVSIRESLAEESPEKTSDSICSDNSFLKLEQMVSELCMPSENRDYNELDNTLEVVEYILQHGPGKITKVKQDNDKNETANNYVNPDIGVKQECMLNEDKLKTPMEAPPATKIISASPDTPRNIENITTHLNAIYTEENGKNKTTNNGIKSDSGLKHQFKLDEMKHCQMKTPLSMIPASLVTPRNNQPFRTPRKDAIIDTPIFKTPASTLLPKKPSTSSVNKKTPVKNCQYAHIASPVACYIKNSPQVPLVQDVHPKKPLPSCSSNIPKLILSKPKTILCNKENINLPSLAYIGAKKTKMIYEPSAKKLPESQLAKKITSSLPRPVVVKHAHRETNKTYHPHENDSFANLPLNQADLSVCTQKSAFCKPKSGV